jgi:hypothetical protein
MQLMKFISQLVTCNSLKTWGYHLVGRCGCPFGVDGFKPYHEKKGAGVIHSDVQGWNMMNQHEPTNYLTEQETPTIGPRVPQKCLRIFLGKQKHDPCRSHLNLQLWIWAVLKRVTSKHRHQKLCHEDKDFNEYIIFGTENFAAWWICLDPRPWCTVKFVVNFRWMLFVSDNKICCICGSLREHACSST